MSHINTLKAFDNFVESGINPEIARAHVILMDESFDGLDAVRKAELDYAISGIKTEFNHSFDLLRKDFSHLKWQFYIVGTIFIIPAIQSGYQLIMNLVK